MKSDLLIKCMLLIFSWPDRREVVQNDRDFLSVVLPGHAYYRYLILKDQKGKLLPMMSISTVWWDLLFCLWWIDGPCWEVLSEEIRILFLIIISNFIYRTYILASKPTGTKSSNFLNTIKLNVHLKGTLIN